MKHTPARRLAAAVLVGSSLAAGVVAGAATGTTTGETAPAPAAHPVAVQATSAQPAVAEASTVVGQSNVSVPVTGVSQDPSADQVAARDKLAAGSDVSLDGAGTLQAPEVKELADTALIDTEAADAEDVALLSEPVVNQPFTLAAATWPTELDSRVDTVEIRVRIDGQWGQWERLNPASLEAADVPRLGTEPMIAFGADGAQLRVTSTDGKPLQGVELSLIDGGQAVTDDAVAGGDSVIATKTSAVTPTAQTVSATTSTTSRAAEARQKILPNVITRAQWGANESWASNSYQSSSIKALTLHHTAGSNNYSREQAVNQMRSIYSYYTQTLRWGDFPYHLITDKFGNIYEGRRGALTSNPIGTHAGGFNPYTMGISTLGNYHEVRPPQQVVDAMARAVAFYLYRDGIDPNGTTVLTADRVGSTKYGPYTRVTVDTIHGHFTVSNTACPGQYLIPKMPEIRTKAAKIAAGAQAPTPAPTPAPAPAPAPVTGAGGTLQITGVPVNLRSSASWSASSLGVLKVGESVTATGRTSGVFTQVRTSGGVTGWVPTANVSEVANRQITGVPVNLRSSASWSASSLGVLKVGEIVTATGSTSGMFTQVRTSAGTTGWVPTANLSGATATPTPAPNPETPSATATVTIPVNLRTNPSWSSSTNGQIGTAETIEFAAVSAKGDPFKARGKLAEMYVKGHEEQVSGAALYEAVAGDSWWRISSKHNIPLTDLYRVNGATANTVITLPYTVVVDRSATVYRLANTTTLNVRDAAPDTQGRLGSLVTTVKGTATLTGTGTRSGNWVQVVVGGKVGWVNGYYLR